MADNKAGAERRRPPADVFLDVPNLSVQEIGLEVDNLTARVSVEARLADLLHLHVGIDARIESVKLSIKGVEAQAQLRVRLDKVLAIVERTLETIDKNPEILTELAQAVGDTGEALGEGVGEVGKSVGELGKAAS